MCLLQTGIFIHLVFVFVAFGPVLNTLSFISDHSTSLFPTESVHQPRHPMTPAVLSSALNVTLRGKQLSAET